MMLYLVFFAITIILMWFALIFSEKCKKIRLPLLIVCCLPLCWLAGMRANSVGTDVKVYIEPIYNAAVSSDSLTNLNKSHPDTEIGYLTINWIISRASFSFSGYLFFLELFILALFVVGIYRVNKKNHHNILFCFVIILILFYNRSLNAARQVCAISIIISGACYLIKGDIKKALPYILIASLFHKTALLLIPILLIGLIKRPKLKFFAYILLFIATLLYRTIIIFAVSKGILPVKFLLYTTDFVIDFNINFGEELLRIFLIALCLETTKYNKNSRTNTSKSIIISDIIILQLGCFVEYASRASWYLLSLYPIIYSTIPPKTNKKNNGKILLILALLVYWWWSFAYCNYGETIPYSFS